ncbi:MAG TPA: hypothetical protein VHY35_18775 [Stellaceae bacterium]|jgi:hypothetical protein|nr:hypothetical protein [Stellaceae bacterium]
MLIGPTLIFDKSTLQSLRINEAEWLSHHFHLNLIEPLYVEVLGAAGVPDRKNPIADMASMAEKLLGIVITTAPNMSHRKLIINNLLGQDVVMNGRIILDNIQYIRRADGGITAFQDEPPEIEALRRLARGELSEREITGIAMLRDFKAMVDLNRIKEAFDRSSWIASIATLEDILLVVDRVLNEVGRYRALRHAMEHFQVPSCIQRSVLARWKREGGPRLKDFAPYAYHVLRVDRFFDMGIGSGLIKVNDSNHYIDVMYLYYLPFCEIFSSTDKFHRQIVPLFMRDDQRFYWGTDVKDGAVELTAFYETISDATRRTGSMNYARLPPKEQNLWIARVYDDLRPGWRDW